MYLTTTGNRITKPLREETFSSGSYSQSSWITNKTDRARTIYFNSSKFGWETRLGLYGHRMSFQEFRNTKEMYAVKSGYTLASIGTENIVVSTIKKANYNEGFVVRLQEVAGNRGEAEIAFKDKKIREAFITDSLERRKVELEVSGEGSVKIHVEPWSVISINVIF